jgi:hypothetical protein
VLTDADPADVVSVMVHSPSSLADGHEATIVVLPGQVVLALSVMHSEPSLDSQEMGVPPPLLLLPKPLLPELPPHWLLHDCWQLFWLMVDPFAHCTHACVSTFGTQPWRQVWSPGWQAQKQLKKSAQALVKQLALQFDS